ncbi:unnamed protein product [Protopolystoma xenopodis]|uniref:Uncharacterized protein n=1 Tax=Protopolystoma xenopodis TaxID=117903 RepID=A0A3S5AXV5_9PLAT|nr:unnamed protein product [Protopolystoma xenopodis]
MLHCWSYLPRLRPTFLGLVALLGPRFGDSDFRLASYFYEGCLLPELGFKSSSATHDHRKDAFDHNTGGKKVASHIGVCPRVRRGEFNASKTESEPPAIMLARLGDPLLHDASELASALAAVLVRRCIVSVGRQAANSLPTISDPFSGTNGFYFGPDTIKDSLRPKAEECVPLQFMADLEDLDPEADYLRLSEQVAGNRCPKPQSMLTPTPSVDHLVLDPINALSVHDVSVS